MLRCWQGGCIIRADLLKDFRKAYADDPSLENLLMHPPSCYPDKDRIHAWRAVVGVAVQRGLPVPALSASWPATTRRRPYLENASQSSPARLLRRHSAAGGTTRTGRTRPSGVRVRRSASSPSRLRGTCVFTGNPYHVWGLALKARIRSKRVYENERSAGRWRRPEVPHADDVRA